VIASPSAAGHAAKASRNCWLTSNCILWTGITTRRYLKAPAAIFFFTHRLRHDHCPHPMRENSRTGLHRQTLTLKLTITKTQEAFYHTSECSSWVFASSPFSLNA
jgi:hypothetical protein